MWRRATYVARNIWPASKVLFEIEKYEERRERRRIVGHNVDREHVEKPNVLRTRDSWSLIQNMTCFRFELHQRSVNGAEESP